MEQENEELEMQNNSNNIFDNFVNGIEEHPKEAGVGILGLLAALGITNFIQWRKDGKSKIWSQNSGFSVGISDRRIWQRFFKKQCCRNAAILYGV